MSNPIKLYASYWKNAFNFNGRTKHSDYAWTSIIAALSLLIWIAFDFQWYLDYILDKVTFNNLLFFPKNFYVENNIKFIGSTKITKVDFDNKKISSSLNTYEYDQLLIATGSSNRHLVINEKKILPGKQAVVILAVEQVGNYAVKLRFDDGHDTGIYSWKYLYH